MPQYDLLLTQNTHATLTEFSEKYVNITKGGLLSSAAAGVPTVLPVGADTYHLVANSATATGLEWVSVSAGHTQGTDSGTTSSTFTVDSDGTTGKIIFDADNTTGNYTTTIQNTTQSANIVLTLPSVTGTLATEAYASGLFASTDAMIFKGTIGTAGTHTIAAFNALTTYDRGWTYRVIEAGTIRSVVCEIGDLVMVIMDRSGSGNLDADFAVAQTNLDGAVIGPSSATDNYVALFSGTTGKLLKAGTGALGTAAYTASTAYATSAQGSTADAAVPKSLYDVNSILYATTDNTPAALTIAASTVVGRKATGDIAALSPAELANVLTVTAPATKTSTGIAGQIAFDSNFLYRCISTNLWTRAPMATNW